MAYLRKPSYVNLADYSNQYSQFINDDAIVKDKISEYFAPKLKSNEFQEFDKKILANLDENICEIILDRLNRKIEN